MGKNRGWKKICAKCGREFVARHYRLAYCVRPECQEARKEAALKYTRDYVRKWQKEHKGMLKECKNKKDKRKENSNWTKHHIGRCFKSATEIS